MNTQLLRDYFDGSSPGLLERLSILPYLAFCLWLALQMMKRRQSVAPNGKTEKTVHCGIAVLFSLYIGAVLYATIVTLSLQGFSVLVCVWPCIVILSFWCAFRLMIRPQP
jgi:hypothetical protein